VIVLSPSTFPAETKLAAMLLAQHWATSPTTPMCDDAKSKTARRQGGKLLSSITSCRYHVIIHSPSTFPAETKLAAMLLAQPWATSPTTPMCDDAN
jgi:hypothetical protein